VTRDEIAVVADADRVLAGPAVDPHRVLGVRVDDVVARPGEHAVEAVPEPTECTLGDPDFRIYVSGTGFYEQSTLVFAGQDEPTTFEDGKLSTGVNMAVWQGPDTVQVGVRNGPIESNTMPFTFKAAETPEAEGQWRTTSVSTATPPGHDADADYSDPDELEDELDQAREEGDFTPARGKRR